MTTLQEAIESNSITTKAGTTGQRIGDSILEQLDETFKKMPFSPKTKIYYEQKIETLVNDYFLSLFIQKYDVLSKDLFELTKTISLSKIKEPNITNLRGDELDEKDYNKFIKTELTIPMFALSHISEEWKLTCPLAEGSNYRITLSANCPFVIEPIAEKGELAIADSYEILSKALRQPQIRKCVNLKKSQDREWRGFPTPRQEDNLYVLWKPTVESMSAVIDKDPALLLSFGGQYYIIGLWDTPEEEPFRHYMKEFAKRGDIPLLNNIEDKTK